MLVSPPPLPSHFQSCLHYETMLKMWRNNFELMRERRWVLYLTVVSLAAIFFFARVSQLFCNWLQLWLYYCHWTNTAHCLLGHFSKSKIWGIHKCFLSWWLEQLQTHSLSVDLFMPSVVLSRHVVRKWLQYWDTTACFDPNHCLFCCDFHWHVALDPLTAVVSAAMQDYTALKHCNFLNDKHCLLSYKLSVVSIA